MIFISYNSIDSTQLKLLEFIKSCENSNSFIVFHALDQNGGVGSRGNSWSGVKEGLYISIALKKDLLPSDLPMQSCSIYFGMIFLQSILSLQNENLYSQNSLLWLKWPNDLYLQDFKIGGVITNIYRDFIISGFGLNILDDKFTSLHSSRYKASIKDIILSIFKHFNILNIKDIILGDDELKDIKSSFSKPLKSFKEIFDAYKLQFKKSKSHSFHHKECLFSLKDSILQEDGSIKIKDKIFYSAR